MRRVLERAAAVGSGRLREEPVLQGQAAMEFLHRVDRIGEVFDRFRALGKCSCRQIFAASVFIDRCIQKSANSRYVASVATKTSRDELPRSLG